MSNKKMIIADEIGKALESSTDFSEQQQSSDGKKKKKKEEPLDQKLFTYISKSELKKLDKKIGRKAYSKAIRELIQNFINE